MCCAQSHFVLSLHVTHNIPLHNQHGNRTQQQAVFCCCTRLKVSVVIEVHTSITIWKLSLMHLDDICLCLCCFDRSWQLCNFSGVYI